MLRSITPQSRFHGSGHPGSLCAGASGGTGRPRLQGGLRPGWRGRVPVRPARVGVGGVGPEHLLEVPSAAHERPVQAFGSHRADPSLGEGVRPGSSKRSPDHVDPFRARTPHRRARRTSSPGRGRGLSPSRVDRRWRGAWPAGDPGGSVLPSRAATLATATSPVEAP